MLKLSWCEEFRLFLMIICRCLSCQMKALLEAKPLFGYVLSVPNCLTNWIIKKHVSKASIFVFLHLLIFNLLRPQRPSSWKGINEHSVCPYVTMSVCAFVFLSICIYVYISVSISVYLYELCLHVTKSRYFSQ